CDPWCNGATAGYPVIPARRPGSGLRHPDAGNEPVAEIRLPAHQPGGHGRAGALMQAHRGNAQRAWPIRLLVIVLSIGLHAALVVWLMDSRFNHPIVQQSQVVAIELVSPVEPEPVPEPEPEPEP